MRIYNFDSQALTSSASDMDRFELATLYTLQDRLSRNAEPHGCFEHGKKAGRCFFEEPSPQLIGDTDAPGGAGSKLFAGDEAVAEPAMNSRWSETEDLCSPLDSGKFTRWCSSGRLEARDVAIATETTDLICGEALAVSGLATLTIENAGDDVVGVVSGQPSQQFDRVFVGANAGRLIARQGKVDGCERTATPAHGELAALFSTVHDNDYFFEQGAQEFFSIPIGGGGRRPHLL